MGLIPWPWQARRNQRRSPSSARSPRRTLPFLALTLVWFALGCSRSLPPDLVTVVIESSPNSLDPRIGTDAQSERLCGLLFDSLVHLDPHFEPQPALATRWENPTPTHWLFHLRPGVRFSDGRPLEADDVAYTLRSLVDGTLVTAKAGAFSAVDRVVVPDPLTVELDLKHPDANLLFNLSDGRFGVVPRGAGRDFAQHPVGSGPFVFRSQAVDKEVLLDRNPHYWADSVQPTHGNLQHLRFAVVPDAVTATLELRKGTADVAVNVVTLDMVHVLEQTPGLLVEHTPGSPVLYLNFNVRGGLEGTGISVASPSAADTFVANPLADRRVRQAIACALDRDVIIRSLWHGRARPAATLLPPEHWAAAPAATLPQYPHDPAHARALLTSAGFRADAHGTLLHLEMKTSTDESTRLFAIVLQQQLREAGIDLTLRSSEFGTFYADVTRGAFEMYALRWIGSNESPDIFRYAFATSQFPPSGGNRGHYSNPRLDALLDDAAAATDRSRQLRDYLAAQEILAEDLPAIPLWYPDNNVIHTARLREIHPSASGDYSFLRDARLP